MARFKTTDKNGDTPLIRMNARLIFNELKKGKRFRRVEFEEMFGLSESTAKKSLKRLVTLGVTCGERLDKYRYFYNTAFKQFHQEELQTIRSSNILESSRRANRNQNKKRKARKGSFPMKNYKLQDIREDSDIRTSSMRMFKYVGGKS